MGPALFLHKEGWNNSMNANNKGGVSGNAEKETGKKPTPVIEGERIVLRYALPGDLAAYMRFLEDREMIRLTGSGSEAVTEQAAKDWLDRIGKLSDDRADFMIVPKGGDGIIGEVVINEYDADNRHANIRIGICGADNRGKGYGSEAMALMMRYGFEHFDLHRLELSVYDFNPRAIHVYEKLGFRREGIQRDVLYLDGRYYHSIVMSILEEEFREEYGI